MVTRSINSVKCRIGHERDARASGDTILEIDLNVEIIYFKWSRRRQLLLHVGMDTSVTLALAEAEIDLNL